jgi:hypothetical protein
MPTGTGVLTTQRPNMRFVVPAVPSGSLVGHVTYGLGTPLVGATVTSGTLTSTTDANGRYNFPALTPGSVSVTCAKAGYTSQTTSVSVTLDVTTTQNFLMVAIPQVNVTGHVISNDGAVVEGAAIALTGMAPYSGTTDASGDFTITGVYADQTYGYTISKAAHTSSTGSINVLGTNYNMGTITLNENATAATNVVATEVASNVSVTWTAPAGIVTGVSSFDFESTNGSFIATNSPSTGWEWGTSAFAGSHSGTNIWGSVLSGTYPDNAINELVSPAISVGSGASLTFWHRYDLENDGTAWDGGVVQISTNAGSTWTTITPVGGYPEADVAALGNVPGYNGYLDTWTQASFDLTAYASSNVMFKFLMMSDGLYGYEGWFIDDVSVTAARDFTTSSSRNDRGFVGYNVYRFLAADEATPAAWTQVATTISSTSYTDTDWSTQAAGSYKWAVEAVYSGNLLSPAAASNSLYRLGVPTDIVATLVGSTIHLAWPAVSLASGYKVYASDDIAADFSTWTQLTFTGNTYYDFVIGDTDHKYFRIVAIKLARDEAARNSNNPLTPKTKQRIKK